MISEVCQLSIIVINPFMLGDKWLAAQNIKKG